MKAMQAMTRNVVCIHAHDSIETAKDIMDEWDIRHLPVVDHGKLVGMLSDRDILLRTSLTSNNVKVVDDCEVRDAMTARVITCSPTDSIAKIASAMTDKKIDSVPVVEDDGELVGLVTSTDLLELLKERDVLDSTRVLPWSYQLRFKGPNFNDGRPSYLE
jgi:acetoin utilization protein AcuB